MFCGSTFSRGRHCNLPGLRKKWCLIDLRRFVRKFQRVPRHVPYKILMYIARRAQDAIPRFNQSPAPAERTCRLKEFKVRLSCIGMNISTTASHHIHITCSQPPLRHLLCPSANPSHSQSKVPLDNEHDGLVVSLEHVTPWDRFIVLDRPSSICEWESGSPLGLIDKCQESN